jgi:very-short-patch-repair endonuclease
MTAPSAVRSTSHDSPPGREGLGVGARSACAKKQRYEEPPYPQAPDRQGPRPAVQRHPQERILWRLLSRFRPKFTRQLSIDPYTADLACREAKLIVEIDGSQHIGSVQDEHRTDSLAAEGWTVIRFSNSEVNQNPEGVAEAILLKAAECLGGTNPQPISPDPKDHTGHGPPG